MNNDVYLGGLSVFGLPVDGYLLYSKLKNSEQNLIDVRPLPVNVYNAETNIESERDIFEMP